MTTTTNISAEEMDKAIADAAFGICGYLLAGRDREFAARQVLGGLSSLDPASHGEVWRRVFEWMDDGAQESERRYHSFRRLPLRTVCVEVPGEGRVELTASEEWPGMSRRERREYLDRIFGRGRWCWPRG